MTPVSWIILLFAAGVIVLIAELVLPSHGLLGVIGVVSISAAIVMCFRVNLWLGAGVMLTCVIATPFVGAWVVKIWPKTPVGRRIVLGFTESRPEPLAVQIGQSGVAISELRPMGVVEFDGRRVEAISELGVIAAGQSVKVVSVDNRRPVVRAAGADKREDVPA